MHYRALFAELLGDEPVPPPQTKPTEPTAEAAAEPTTTVEAADGDTAQSPSEQPHYR